jgi:hypothetical protein
MKPFNPIKALLQGLYPLYNLILDMISQMDKKIKRVVSPSKFPSKFPQTDDSSQASFNDWISHNSRLLQLLKPIFKNGQFMTLLDSTPVRLFFFVVHRCEEIVCEL